MARIILIIGGGAASDELEYELGTKYTYLKADTWSEGKLLLLREYKMITGILLCVENGDYEPLSYIRGNSSLSQIPVVVISGEAGDELRALSLGANDFIARPYDAQILSLRVDNNTELRERASVFNAFQLDKLTGLYNRDAFFEKAAWLIKRRPAGYYVMASFDIDSFKVINDQYGMEKGDEMLIYVAEVFRNGFEPCGGLCCRVMSDNFAVLYPRELLNSEQLTEIRRVAERQDGSILPISFSIGRYVIDDLSLTVSAMYDRAVMAENSVKGRYRSHAALYDESMREKLLRKQTLVTEMGEALIGGQFETWYQPQYNHATGALIGAEALSRWRHPLLGLISPKEFIPIFEKNGFIYELDRYTWENACRTISKWLREGRSPLPVSVNVSRYDIFKDDIVRVLTELVEKYDIPVSLLRLEITESAFADTTEQIISVVRRLLDRGFVIEIDDFGSGYSSLNTLKDVPAQIIKLDMRFLENTENTERSGSIVKSVMRMARWLGMSVIAEGTETLEQADYLRSIGCFYIQGYVYARPMQLHEYEELMERSDTESQLLPLSHEDTD